MVLCNDSTTATILSSLPLFRPVGCHPLCGGAGSLYCTLKPAAFSSFLILLLFIYYIQCSCDRHLGLYYVSVFDPIVLWIDPLWAFAVFSGWPEINFYYYYYLLQCARTFVNQHNNVILLCTCIIIHTSCRSRILLKRRCQVDAIQWGGGGGSSRIFCGLQTPPRFSGGGGVP